MRRPSCTLGEKARRHACSRWHRDLVEAYRAERERQESALEALTGGYAADYALYVAQGGRPLVTFREWLRQYAGRQEVAA